MKEKEVKKGGRSTKSKVMTVMLGVSLFCVFSILLLVICEKEVKPNKPIKKEETNVKIKYEIKETANCEETGGINCKTLYVNGKEVQDIKAEAVVDSILDFGDAIVVIESWGDDIIYFINSDGIIFKSIAGVNVNEINDKEIYYTILVDSFNQDRGLICNYKDNMIIYTEEKVVYEGNEKVSSPVVIKNMTKKEYLHYIASEDEDLKNICNNN